MIRINKMVNSLDYHPCPSRLASRIHPFIFLYTHEGFISLSPECLLNFLSNSYIPSYVGKIFKFMELTFLENALIRGIFTHSIPHSKLVPKFLSSHPRQKEITHSPRQHSLENLFFPTAEKGGGNYDLLYQNSVRNFLYFV